MTRHGLRGPTESAAGGEEMLGDASWLYSYADMVTQLLLFVILIVTFQGLKQFDFNLDPSSKPAGVAVEDIFDNASLRLEKVVQDEGVSHQVAIDRIRDRLVLRLGSVLLFDEGQATLSLAARRVLTGVAGVLVELGNDTRVEGHTDDVPINTAVFPSNWELATARAIAVVEYLVERGVAKQTLSAAGYGEFRPVVDNDGADGRATNRRVEIVILSRQVTDAE